GGTDGGGYTVVIVGPGVSVCEYQMETAAVLYVHDVIAGREVPEIVEGRLDGARRRALGAMASAPEDVLLRDPDAPARLEQGAAAQGRDHDAQAPGHRGRQELFGGARNLDVPMPEQRREAVGLGRDPRGQGDVEPFVAPGGELAHQGA